MGTLILTLLVTFVGLGVAIQLGHELFWNTGFKWLETLDFKPLNCAKCLSGWAGLFFAPYGALLSFASAVTISGVSAWILVVGLALALAGAAALGATLAQYLQNSSTNAFLTTQLNNDVLSERYAQRRARIEAAEKAELEKEEAPKPNRKTRRTTKKK